MSGFKLQQRHLLIEGRTFHFVAYEGQAENAARHLPAVPPMWCLMVEGRRCPVTPFVDTQDETMLNRLLLRWVRANALPGAPGSTPEPLPST